MDAFKDRAVRVINGAFGGAHHVYALKWPSENCCTFLVQDYIATYDYGGLTKLVVHCHDECVRGSISGGGPRMLKITLSNRARKHKHPDAGAHPELEQHIEQVRRGSNYQPLFDLLREGE